MWKLLCFNRFTISLIACFLPLCSRVLQTSAFPLVSSVLSHPWQPVTTRWWLKLKWSLNNKSFTPPPLTDSQAFWSPEQTHWRAFSLSHRSRCKVFSVLRRQPGALASCSESVVNNHVLQGMLPYLSVSALICLLSHRPLLCGCKKRKLS